MKKQKEEITKETRIGEALQKNKKAAEILFGAGLMCIGCPMSQGETIEEGALAHGLTKKNIDEIIKKLNK
jgi:hybrid cluster-associated redox disulfide protein